MPPTVYHVDPSLASNTGTGTAGDPFGDLQYGLNTVTRDATNGDHFRILDTADEILASTLSLATYGTPTAAAPLILAGSADNPATIDCNGNQFLNAAKNVHLHHLTLTNGSTAAYLVSSSGAVHSYNVRYTNAWGGILADAESSLRSCRFDNLGPGYAVTAAGDGVTIAHCFFTVATYAGNCDRFVNATAAAAMVESCLFDCDGDTVAIYLASTATGATIRNNTIYSAAGTGAGIDLQTGALGHHVLNNYVEGFSGTGGHGIRLPSGAQLATYGFNTTYNNTTERDISGPVLLNLANNETASASALTNPAADNFAATADLAGTAYPNHAIGATFSASSTDTFIDRGAAQRDEGAPSGTPTNIHLHRRRRVTMQTHTRRPRRPNITTPITARETILLPRRRRTVTQHHPRRRPVLFAAPTVIDQTVLVVSRPRRVR